MKKKVILISFTFLSTFLVAQTPPPSIAPINGADLLKKTIEYHDPKGNWSSFRQKLYFHAKEPRDTNIRETVFLDNRFTYFRHESRPDGKLVEKIMQDTLAIGKLNGDTAMSADDRKKYRLSPRAIRGARNSYVFLYGLPMKLTDNGVLLNDTVKIDTFNGKKYWVLNARFDKNVGSDTWYLYINPQNWAMEGYRFYHNRKPNDGEFIICEEILEIQQIKIPRIRYWHSNENGEWGATDIIDRNEAWELER